MRRVVMMVVDGLRADLLSEATMPRLAALAASGCVFDAHRAAFPSATRVNSATLATGCHPARHGLMGNAIALDEGDGLVAVSVGPASFRERWRAATGATLRAPTLAERLAPHGGVTIYSNSSAGAAHLQDPDGHGTLYHRDGSHGPGLVPIVDGRHPDVDYDASGDREVTSRFVAGLSADPRPFSLLWICEPDHSQHAQELGSTQHLETLAGADARVGEVAAAVARLRARGDDVLFLLCSDHGHETATEIVPVAELAAAAGLLEHLDTRDVVFASSGMSALVYLSPRAAERETSLADWLAAQPWCDRVFAGDALTEVGLAPRDGLAIAFAMSKSDAANRFGIPGSGTVCADPFSPHDAVGRGQHGGLGRYETRPVLLITDTGVPPRRVTSASHAVDVAATVLDALGLPGEGLDGRSLLERTRGA